MSKKPDSSPGQEPKPNGFNLDALLPLKATVDTSIGTLYVRHAYATDWKSFGIDDVGELGMAAMQQLSSRVEDKHDSGPLSDEDLEGLSDKDILLLVPAISKRSGWGEMRKGAGLKELGETVKAAREKEAERHKQMLADLRKSIDSSYGFLGQDTLKKLQEQMAGLAEIRSSLADDKLHQAVLRASYSHLDVLKESLVNAKRLDDVGRHIKLQSSSSPVGISETIETPNVFIPPRPEDTSLGKATLESAENSREFAQKMDALVMVVAGLNQIFIQDVLPAWFTKIKDDQRDAKGAFEQTATGLRWTKWAVFASIFVTSAATGWQIKVARDIDRGNTEQQKQTETILREQLAAQRKLIEQQTIDSAALRDAIAKTRSSPPLSAKPTQ